MEIIEIFANQPIDITEASVACIGFFDGVHRGHQALIAEAKKRADEKQVLASCVTFYEDPWIVLKGIKDVTHITPTKKRFERIASFGIDRCYVLHFDQVMANYSIEAFIALLKELKIVGVVVGDDFRFAKGGSGSVVHLQTAFDTVVEPLLLWDHQKIASSSIESAILAGDMLEVNKCLGVEYSLCGEVVKGNQIGRTLGFPTANLKLEEAYVIPKKGVYAGYVKIQGFKYYAMINIGHNPTLNFQKQVSIEVHILDFNKNIYGQTICVYFSTYIRDEIKFENKEQLITQLNQDIVQIRGR